MRISDWSSDLCSSVLVRSRLELSGFDKVAGRRVVLTGGACQLPGTRELASTVLDKQVRIGRPTLVTGLAEATAGPDYATCAGLLNYAVIAAVAVPRGGPGRGGTGLTGRTPATDRYSLACGTSGLVRVSL